ncbi:MAG TPA: phosphoglycerate mutase family protein, partial [Myxococcota bacterium]|nr:phosphoglycerate mutase family protein [Myxococcota bacterium]
MARLILIRHGESVANAQQRFTFGPFEPLTTRGRAEALAIAALVRTHFDPVALYASPFVRALETAQQVGG